MPLHRTLKPFPLGFRPGIHKLTLEEPVRRDTVPHRQQPILIPHPKLADMPLGRNLAGREMAQKRSIDIGMMPPTRSNLYGKVPMLLHRLVCNDLDPIKLQHGARNPVARLGVVHDRHAPFDGNGSGTEGDGVSIQFALESGSSGGLKSG